MVITGVQLELGSTASAFAYRPPDQEYAMCKRYCQAIEYVHSGYALIGNPIRVAVNHPVTLRAAPVTSTIIGAASNVNVSSAAVAASITQSNYGGTATATGPFTISAQYRHEAELS
jgi:hypothetical protein